ncbi:MAG: YHYH protein [Acidimicrobiaceae bacterium]|nr:YHYH protein [Acidimicrobiaceae bacterium]
MRTNATTWIRCLAVMLAVCLVLSGCGRESMTEPMTPTDNAVAEIKDLADDAEVEDAAISGGSSYLGSYTLDDAEFGTQVTVTVGGASRTIETNALPDHTTGDFPNAGNPNTISAQDLRYEYTTEPEFAGEASSPLVIGVAVNGVKFEPGTAESVSCASGETYRVEALQDIYNLGLDFNNAHVQPTGEYHYHGAPQLLTDAYALDDDLVLVGFAADGYLMYYSKSGAYQSGYQLVSAARTGTGCTASSALRVDGVEVHGTSPDGTFTSDWVWSDEAGDLDECNGGTIDGSYAYVITHEFPYISRCLNGDVGDAGGVPLEGAEGAAPGLSEAADALGISVAELISALGGPPPDIDAAAKTLGISVQELMAVLPGPRSAG